MIWTWILRSKLARFTALLAALVGGLAAYGLYRETEGKKEAEHEAVKDSVERVEKGRDAVRDSRDLPPDEQLRRNDGVW